MSETKEPIKFTHLHVHSEYSLLDGACRIKALVKKIKKMGMTAVAVTDHGNMYGAYKFCKEAKEAGINGILGCEFYIVDDLLNKQPKEHKGHLVLLAKNQAGYINLCKLNSKAWVDGFYGKPRIDYNFLASHSDGLVCLSGCLAGHIQNYLMNGHVEQAKKYAVRLKEIFGDDFYIELQDHGLQEQRAINPKLIAMARELGIQLVATNDVHYLEADDAEMQDAMMCVEMKKLVDDPDRMKFQSDQFYLKTGEDMAALFPEIPEAISNTNVIADKCKASIIKQDLIPMFETPTGEDNVTYFKRLTEEGIIKKYGKVTPEIRERIDREYPVIINNGFTDYYLIVADFIGWAKSHGIAVNLRGSGAGSIIAYALNITEIEPLKYDLIFERFLHSERISPPDFDIDFCCKRREEVIDYVINKYGSDKVCQIVTFGTMAARAAIKDIGRVFRVPYSETDKITKPMVFKQSVKPPVLPYVFDKVKLTDPKTLPDWESKSEAEKEDALAWFKRETSKVALCRNPELIEIYNADPAIKKVVDMAMKVEGMPRNCSTHAAGVIICKKPVGDVTPLQRNGDDVTSQYDMVEIEECGMLKMDFLGLITLTDIQSTVEEIKRTRNIEIDFKTMQYDDAEVYKLIATGDTDAVFQLESGGMKSFMKMFKPDCLEDIIAAVALYRPGPMDNIPDYCKRKHNPELVKYDHPTLEPILKNTYGIIIYQEQVQSIFRQLAGYTLGQADMVRRAMGKKKIKDMEIHRHIFIDGDAKMGVKGAVANGVNRETAVVIYEKMAKFAEYAFNKAHATCYAYTAYQTGFLKRYYYPEFMASVLNNRITKSDEITKYMLSIKQNGTKVLPPDINKSAAFFSVDGADIRFGLGGLKGVGIGVIENILKERTANGPFTSFYNFINRISSEALNKRVLESFILGGAFDCFSVARSKLMAVYEQLVERVIKDKRAKESGQFSMFDLVPQSSDTYSNVEYPNISEYDSMTKLKLEKEIVGIYISGHPIEQFASSFSGLNFNTSYIKRTGGDEEGNEGNVEIEENETDGDEFTDGSAVAFGAVITNVKITKTKIGQKSMAILTVEDLYGSGDVMLFPQMYDRFKHLCVKDNVVIIKGKLSIRAGEDSIVLCDSMTVVHEGNKVSAPVAVETAVTCKLYLRYDTTDGELHRTVSDVLAAYEGDAPTIVKCVGQNQAFALNMFVRPCKAVVWELASILGAENVQLIEK